MEHSSISDYVQHPMPQFHIDQPEHYTIVNPQQPETRYAMLGHLNNGHVGQIAVNHAQPGENVTDKSAILLRKAWVESPSWTGSYANEWYRLFGDLTIQRTPQHGSPIQIDHLRDSAFTGQLRNSRFRSVCWRIHLGILPLDVRHWNMAITRHRRSFQEINYMVNLDPHSFNIWDHPLALDRRSRWYRYFRTREIKRVIAQDVDRTFPEVEYFRSPRVQAAMVNVLYCYVELTGSDYKQGMHELLAPLFFVLHSDQIAFQHACETNSIPAQLKSYLTTLLSDRYLEADAFVLFNHIMTYVQSWYASEQIIQNSGSGTDSDTEAGVVRLFDSTSSSSRQVISNPGVSYLDEVHNKLLQKHNQELYYHLKKLDIVPALFGLRWIRLLFGHEFPLEDLLYIWDCLFAEGENLILVQYIYVSMLDYLSTSLLHMGYSDCLSRLMRFPRGVDVTYLIQMALHFYQPKQHAAPMHPQSPNRTPAVETPKGARTMSQTDLSQKSCSNAASPAITSTKGTNTSVTATAVASTAAAIATMSRSKTLGRIAARRNTLFDFQLIPAAKSEQREVSKSTMSLNRLLLRDQRQRLQTGQFTPQLGRRTSSLVKPGEKLCSVELHQRCHEVAGVCWNHITSMVDELERETHSQSNGGDSLSQSSHSDGNTRANLMEHLQIVQSELEKLSQWLIADDEPSTTHPPQTSQTIREAKSIRRTGSLGLLIPAIGWRPKSVQSGTINLSNGWNKSPTGQDSPAARVAANRPQTAVPQCSSSVSIIRMNLIRRRELPTAPELEKSKLHTPLRILTHSATGQLSQTG